MHIIFLSIGTLIIVTFPLYSLSRLVKNLTRKEKMSFNGLAVIMSLVLYVGILAFGSVFILIPVRDSSSNAIKNHISHYAEEIGSVAKKLFATPHGDIAILTNNHKWTVNYGNSSVGSGSLAKNETATGIIYSDGSYCIVISDQYNDVFSQLSNSNKILDSDSCPTGAIGLTKRN